MIEYMLEAHSLFKRVHRLVSIVEAGLRNVVLLAMVTIPGLGTKCSR